MNKMAIDDKFFSGLGLAPEMWAQINADSVSLARAAQQAQQANVPNIGQYPATFIPNTPPNTTLAQRAREMFLKRMGGIRAEMAVAPGDYVNCHVHGETVYLFYCFAGKDGCAKENIDMFPSDQFITQFRMILSG
jgi:hypothetical protein